ncbi:MAG: SDR family oxidoreductase, partial [Rhodospirillaceae bacterium]
GGEVLYYSGDASDPCVVAAACAAARGRFGALHGVVHSAIVLNDMAVARMDDAAFRKAYDIKAAGIAALAKAVADAPLDWFLVFSSGLSVLGFPGQSNYAAGCAVKDALVHWLAARSDVSYPVRTINWGYWGTTGIVANPVHERRLAALGLLNMDPAAGMAAIERILASPTPQVLAMKATDALLETLGLRPDRVEAATGPAPEILGPARATGLEADPADPTVAAAWRAGRDAFEAAAPAMVLGALDPLGLRTQLLAAGQAGQVGAEGTKGAGGPAGIGVKALRQSLGIVDRHIRLFTACLRILDRAGLVQLDPGAEDVARVTALPGLAEAASGGPELAAQLGRDHPSTAGFCALTEACLARFAETVTGKTAPTDVLFPEGSMDLVDPIYRGNPEADRCNIQTTAAVVALTKAKLAAAGPEARVTIVEIGAGTGGTTRTLLPDLAPFGDRLRYVYTDISRAFTAHGKRVFGAEYPFVDYTVLDIERDPAPQGFPPCGVDIVVATNVLHATKDMANTLGHVKALLAEGGCLIANEITMASAFTTLTFGLVDGWWLFQDVSER